jgi:hypothetical protein
MHRRDPTTHRDFPRRGVRCLCHDVDEVRRWGDTRVTAVMLARRGCERSTPGRSARGLFVRSFVTCLFARARFLPMPAHEAGGNGICRRPLSRCTRRSSLTRPRAACARTASRSIPVPDCRSSPSPTR